MKKSAHYLLVGLATLALTLTAVEVQATKKAKNERPGDVVMDVKMNDPWKAGKFNFVFDNHMDTHVQLKYDEDDQGNPEELWGSMYVIFTDALGNSLGNDPVSGLPIGRHPRGASHNERCGIDPIVCEVGWHVEAIPGAFRFLFHSGVNGNDHGMWLLNRAEETTAPSPGMVIPQPFIPSHAHWISDGSQDSRAASVSEECNQNNASALESAGPNQVCQGWFMELKAVHAPFAFEHGGEKIPIYPGEDLRSHLNIITNYKHLQADTIDPTR